MEFEVFASLNGPIFIITTLTNVFLLACILFPRQENERLKPPLNVLLGSLVVSNITLQLCILFYILVNYGLILAGDLGDDIVLETVFFAMRIGVTSSLWLSVFYYCQIVPARWCAFLKKHIKVFIYSALIGEKIFYVFGFTVGIMSRTTYRELEAKNMNDSQIEAIYAKMDYVAYLFIADLWCRCGFSCLCVCLMFISSSATIDYLRKNMMSSDSQQKSKADIVRLRRQMRLTITCITQSILFCVCLAYINTNDILKNIFYIFIEWEYYIILTVSSLYSFGSTINLCVGQAIFRQRICDICQKCSKVITCSSE